MLQCACLCVCLSDSDDDENNNDDNDNDDHNNNDNSDNNNIFISFIYSKFKLHSDFVVFIVLVSWSSIISRTTECIQ